MKKTLSILMLLLLLKGGCHAQLQYRLDSTAFRIGEQVALTISGTLQYPSMEMLQQNDIIPISQRFDTLDGKECQITMLTCFEEGEHVLKITPDDSILLTVNDVEGVDTASLEIKDIADIMKEPLTRWECLRIKLLLQALAAVIALVWTFIKRRKEHKPLAIRPAEPTKPADQRAEEALEVLRTKQLWQQGKAKEYHTELTDIVRNFIEERFGFNSTEMTTDQTIEAFEETRFCTPENRSRLMQILQTADMVKFAKSEPQPYEHDRSMSQAKEFVKSCTIAEAPENKEPENTENQQ